MGPVCAKRAAPAPAVDVDLFGFDIAKAAEAALERLHALIEFAAWEASYDIRRDFAACRRRLGVWRA